MNDIRKQRYLNRTVRDILYSSGIKTTDDIQWYYPGVLISILELESDDVIKDTFYQLNQQHVDWKKTDLIKNTMLSNDQKAYLRSIGIITISGLINKCNSQIDYSLISKNIQEYAMRYLKIVPE